MLNENWHKFSSKDYAGNEGSGKDKNDEIFFEMIIMSFSNYAFQVDSITYFPSLKCMSNLQNNSINMKLVRTDNS